MSSIRPKVVILGSGFASFSLLRHIDVKRYAVTLVSPRNHFLFTPLLPSTTVGTIEFRSIIEPVRTARRGFRFHQASVARIDVEQQKLHCNGAFKGSPFELDYDILVIGVGAISNTFNIPGVEEHAFFLKELSEARAIRQRIIENFERASKPNRPVEEIENLLHFVVVGGGPTGVEFAAEVHDFATEDLAKWFPDLMQYVQITLLEATGGILTQFDQKLSEYALKVFKRQRIDVRTHSLVKEVRANGVANAVVLSSGEVIPCGMVVWSTGVGPTGLVAGLDFPKERGRLLVDEYLRVQGRTDIYAIGDCSITQGVGLPPTAQVAQQEGEHVARSLNRLIRGEAEKPFAYRHKGMLAYVGNRKALADFKNVKGRGFATWLVWRSAYLTKLVSLKNKMLVAGDWIRSHVFGRDISRF